MHRQRSFVARLLVGLAAILLVPGVRLAFTLAQTPVTAETPAAGATPEPPGFVLVAKIQAEEWTSSLPALEPGVQLESDSLLAALREGGFVIYVRHASTDFSQSDQDPVDLADCGTQRNLSEEGRKESRLIGDSIAALGIPVGDVLSGEMCRAQDTAELAFDETTTMPELTSYGADGSMEEEAKVKALRLLLATPPEDGTNTVLVGHQFTITEAAGVTLDEGEAAIFLPVKSTPVRIGPPTHGYDAQNYSSSDPHVMRSGLFLR